MQDYNYNCSISFDEYAVIYCENPSPSRNFMAIDEFQEFYAVRQKTIVNANQRDFYERKVKYFSQFKSFVDFIDPEVDLLTELEFDGANNLLPKRPFRVSSQDTNSAANLDDRSDVPRIIQGISTEPYVAVVIETIGDRQLQIYQRVQQTSFLPFFRLKNGLKNMWNIQTINSPDPPYTDKTILSMDFIFDTLQNSYVAFVVTSQRDISLRNDVFTVNQITIPKDLSETDRDS